MKKTNQYTNTMNTTRQWRHRITFVVRNVVIGKWIKALHKLLALSFVIVFIGQGFTGALLSINVEHVETDRLDANQIHPVTFGNIYETVKSMQPKKRITFIQFHPEDFTYEVMLSGISGSDRLKFHGINAEPISTGNNVLFDRQWLLAFHAGKISAPWFKPLLGISAIMMMIVVISGVIRAWQATKLISISTENLQSFMYSTHQTLGVAAAALLLITAGSGVIMIFNQPIREQVFSLTKHEPYPKPMAGSESKQQAKLRAHDVDALVNKAISEVRSSNRRAKDASALAQENIQASIISFPSRVTPTIRVRLKQDDSWHRVGRTQVYFHPVTLEPLHVYNARHANASQRFFDNIYPLHGLHFGNQDLSGIHVVTFILILYFSITGVYLTLTKLVINKKRIAPLALDKY